MEIANEAAYTSMRGNFERLSHEIDELQALLWSLKEANEESEARLAAKIAENEALLRTAAETYQDRYGPLPAHAEEVEGSARVFAAGIESVKNHVGLLMAEVEACSTFLANAMKSAEAALKSALQQKGQCQDVLSRWEQARNSDAP